MQPSQFFPKPLPLISVCYKLLLGSAFQITEFKTNGFTCRDYHLELKPFQTPCCFETLISHLLQLIAILAGWRKEMEIFNNFVSTQTRKNLMRQIKGLLPNPEMLCLPSAKSFLQVGEDFFFEKSLLDPSIMEDFMQHK